MVSFETLDTVSYSHSIATIALSCTISDIKRDTSQKSQFLSYPSASLHSTPPLGVPIGILPKRLVQKN